MKSGLDERKDDLRKEIRRSRRRQVTVWAGVLGALAALLSVYSAGFFLYSVIAVTLLLLISLALASANLAGIEMRRSISVSEIKWGEAVNASLTVMNRKALSAFWLFWEDHMDDALDVEGPTCHAKTLAPSQSHTLDFRIHSTRRGFFRIGPTVVESSGPFGLVRRFLVGRQADFLTVLPRVVPVEKGPAAGQRPIHQIPRRRSIHEDPSRFMGVRDYQPGDSLRRIHWKATARAASLQVKLFEPAVLLGALLAVDMNRLSYPEIEGNSPEKGSLLEASITAAASLGEYILAGDQRVGLISNGTDSAEQYPEDWKGGIFRRIDQALEQARDFVSAPAFQPVDLAPGRGQRQLQQLHSALARLAPTEDFSLPELLMTELPRLPRSLVLVVITPVLDQALDDTLGSLRRSGIETAVVWIRDPNEAEPPAMCVSHRIPVYPVRGDQDIARLGMRSI